MKIPNKNFCPSSFINISHFLSSSNIICFFLGRYGVKPCYTRSSRKAQDNESIVLVFDNFSCNLIQKNQYLNEAIMERLNEVNLAWIGATPGVKFASSGMLIQKKLSDTDLSIPCIKAVILRLLSTGDTIVLSPGRASFDELRNFEHRGKSFQDLAFTCSSG